MKKNILFTDIDSTLIINSKEQKYLDKNKYVCVSKKYGIPAGFMSVENYNKLHELNKLFTIIPITSRCLNSYLDIDFGFIPEFSLVDNGAILLEHNSVNKNWVNESESRIKDFLPEYKRIRKTMMLNDYYEKWGSPFVLDFKTEKQDVNGEKLLCILTEKFKSFIFYPSKTYKSIIVISPTNTKAENVKRFMRKYNIKRELSNTKNEYKVFIAGDSQADWPMLKLTKNSFGIDDGPAQNKYNKDEFKKNISGFTSFILNSLLTK